MFRKAKPRSTDTPSQKEEASFRGRIAKKTAQTNAKVNTPETKGHHCFRRALKNRFLVAALLGASILGSPQQISAQSSLSNFIKKEYVVHEVKKAIKENKLQGVLRDKEIEETVDDILLIKEDIEKGYKDKGVEEIIGSKDKVGKVLRAGIVLGHKLLITKVAQAEKTGDEYVRVIILGNTYEASIADAYKDAATVAEKAVLGPDLVIADAEKSYVAYIKKGQYEEASQVAKEFGLSHDMVISAAEKAYNLYLKSGNEKFLDNATGYYVDAARYASDISLGIDKVKYAAEKAYETYLKQDEYGHAADVAAEFGLGESKIGDAVETGYKQHLENAISSPSEAYDEYKSALELASKFGLGEEKTKYASTKMKEAAKKAYDAHMNDAGYYLRLANADSLSSDIAAAEYERAAEIASDEGFSREKVRSPALKAVELFRKSKGGYNGRIKAITDKYLTD
jgi:hypothetical protein